MQHRPSHVGLTRMVFLAMPARLAKTSRQGEHILGFIGEDLPFPASLVAFQLTANMLI